MKNTHKRFICLTGFLLIFLILSTQLAGCSYKGFQSLGLAINNQDQEEMLDSVSVQNSSSENGSDRSITNEQSFFEMKSQQEDRGILDNVDIRKAIFYAIDRKRIAGELLGDNSEVLDSIFSSGSVYNYGAWKEFEYDPAKAAEYLKKTGYSVEKPLYLTIGTNADNVSRQKIEEIIKENLDSIGIKLWINNKEPDEWFVDYLKNGNYELGIWAINISDFQSMINYFSPDKIPSLESETNKNCNNYYWYDNKNFKPLLEKILNETTTDSKKQLSAELQNMLMQDAFFLPLYSRIFSVAYNKNIKNVEIDTNSGSFFKNISKMDVDMTESGSSSKDNAELSNYVKSIVVGCQHEPYCLNPLIPDNLERNDITGLVVKGLWVKNELGEYLPFIADSISSDTIDSTRKNGAKTDLRVVVSLKENIFWQDGSPITASDVVGTINAIKESNTISSYNGVSYGIIKSVNAVSNKQISIVLNEYNYNWKDLFSVVFPSKMLEGKKIEELFSEDVFGCGPYKLKQWTMGKYLLLERNEYYSGEKPAIDAIKFIFNSDVSYLTGMLKDGTIDILSVPADTSLFEDIKKDTGLDLIIKPGNLFEHLAICLKPVK
jgi:ABC-type transport system substrate-binding protein